MNRLFASVYIDEDVHILVGDLLRAKGFNAVTARDADMSQQSDESQIEFAAQYRMVILTHNRMDYLNLHTRYIAMGIPRSGVILANRFPTSPYWIANEVAEILNRFTADEMENQLFYM